MIIDLVSNKQAPIPAHFKHLNSRVFGKWWEWSFNDTVCSSRFVKVSVAVEDTRCNGHHVYSIPATPKVSNIGNCCRWSEVVAQRISTAGYSLRITLFESCRLVWTNKILCLRSIHIFIYLTTSIVLFKQTVRFFSTTYFYADSKLPTTKPIFFENGTAIETAEKMGQAFKLLSILVERVR